MNNLFFILSVILLFSIPSGAQTDSRNIKLSGLVLRLDSIVPVPSTNIYIKQTNIGVRSSNLGIFSLTVGKNDTIVFSAVGSKTTYYIVSGDLEQGSYSIIQRMPLDTISLETIEINAWPSIEEFNRAFTEEFGFGNDGKSASANAQSRLSNSELGVVMNNAEKANVLYGNQFSTMYENAHIPLNDLLNPTRWNRLVENWKRGINR